VYAYPAQIWVASLGDGTQALFAAGRKLARNQDHATRQSGDRTPRLRPVSRRLFAAAGRLPPKNRAGIAITIALERLAAVDALVSQRVTDYGGDYPAWVWNCSIGTIGSRLAFGAARSGLTHLSTSRTAHCLGNQRESRKQGTGDGHSLFAGAGPAASGSPRTCAPMARIQRSQDICCMRARPLTAYGTQATKQRY
jgi:hypothetical protein